MNSLPIPKENIDAFCYLYKIETGLREFIIDSLQKVVGTRWYKERLPGDILQKYKDGLKAEKTAKWTQLIPHHPLYYVDFPDLKKIIMRQDNWREVFSNTFSRKSIVEGTLEELEPIRNKIAHSRKISSKDVTILKAAYDKISEAIGLDKFTELESRCTYAPDLYHQLTELQREFEKVYKLCSIYEQVNELIVWTSLSNEWWFDDSYLDKKLGNIECFFNIISKYMKLPRHRGSGHKIEAWIKGQDLKARYEAAQLEFSDILQPEGD